MNSDQTVWLWQRIISPHVGGLARDLAKRGYTVRYIAEAAMSEARSALGWSAPDLGAATLTMAASPEEVRALLDEAPAGCIHICQGLRANGVVGVAQKVIRQRGMRHWVTMETIDDRGRMGPIKRLTYNWLARTWGRHVEGLLAIGYRAGDWYRARGFPEERIHPFAYFLSDRSPEPAPAPVSDRPFRFLFVGQFIHRKGFDLLVDALAGSGLQDYELWAVGAGPLEADLRRMAEGKLGAKVVWLGQRPSGQVLDIMREADCLVLPSRFDGWGAVASEALMSGTPVICSDMCGVAGVVKCSQSGGVFAAEEVSSLKAQLRSAREKGVQDEGRRLALAAWADCLGSGKGALYLDSLLRKGATGSRVPPPWRATSGPAM